jgi:hypothetical protein
MRNLHVRDIGKYDFSKCKFKLPNFKTLNGCMHDISFDITLS